MSRTVDILLFILAFNVEASVSHFSTHTTSVIIDVNISGTATSAEPVQITIDDTTEVYGSSTVAKEIESITEDFSSITNTEVIQSSTDATTSCVSEPPNISSIDTINSTAFTVTWEEPDCVPGNLLGYNISITYYPPKGTSTCASENSLIIYEGSNVTSYTFNGAAPYSLYEVSIAAQTGADLGNFSEPQRGRTNEEVSDPPKISSIETINSTAFTVTWEEPDCVPGNLLGYNISITYYPPKGTSTCASENSLIIYEGSNVTSYTFNGAAPYSLYEVSIAAQTGADLGNFSEPQRGRTNEEVSDPPKISSIETINSTAFTVTWEEPDCVPGNLLGYNISITYYSPKDTPTCASENNQTIYEGSNVTSYTFNGAAPYSLYEVSIAAQTGAGLGSFSEPQRGRTNEEVSDPPKISSIETINSTAFTVTWEEPDCVPGNLLGYNISITYYPPKGTSTCASENSLIIYEGSNVTSYTFNGAAPYSLYEVSIAAQTGAGLGSFSEPQRGRTNEEVSDPPKISSIKTINSTAFTLTWEEPDCVPGNLLGYNISITYHPPKDTPTCASENNQTIYEGSNVTSYTFNGAAPYSLYEMSIAAQTGAGLGSFSEPQGGRTNEEVPPAPVITSIKTISSTEFHVVWENSACIPGILQRYILSITYWPNGSTSRCTPGTNDTKNVSIDNMTIKNYIFNESAPYSFYEVKMAATTNAGQGVFSESMGNKTYPGVPGLVQDLNVTDLQLNSTEATFIWNAPCDLNGNLSNYVIYLNGHREGFDDDNRTITVPNETSRLYDLKFEFDYTLTVAAIVQNVPTIGELAVQYFKHPAGIPATLHNHVAENLLNVDPYKTSDPTKQVLISLNSGLFDSYWGKIQYYAVLLAKANMTADSNFLNSTNCKDWNVDLTPLLWVTPSCWNPFNKDSSNKSRNQNNNETVTYTIGDRTHIGTFYNSPLQPDTVYYLKVRGFTKAGYGDTGSIRFQTDSEVAVGMIVGVIVAILLVGIVASLLYMYRSGKLPWPPANLLKRATVDNVRPQPIPLKKFSSHCNLMLDIPARLSSEFQLMATLSVDLASTQSFTAGQLPDNKRKNRYINILPYDSTRVKLEGVDLECDPSADYINASYIKGYTNDIEYIASQGPKEETCTDFWLMVYQQAVKVIIMVTQLEEQGKPKCYKYFPNLRENLVMGDMTVRCTTELHFAIYSSRTFALHKDDRKRTIVHLHFREWPDFGCPLSTDLMLQFCQVIRHHSMLSQPGLMLVHCSAGVGRTGTLIAMDILLQHIRENKKVDIFGTVFKLRKQRLNMVQTEAQYTYIYRCIKDAIEDPSYMKPDKSSTSSMEPIYENVATTLTSVLYEKVPESKSKSNSSESECEL